MPQYANHISLERHNTPIIFLWNAITRQSYFPGSSVSCHMLKPTAITHNSNNHFVLAVCTKNCQEKLIFISVRHKPTLHGAHIELSNVSNKRLIVGYKNLYLT